MFQIEETVRSSSDPAETFTECTTSTEALDLNSDLSSDFLSTLPSTFSLPPLIVRNTEVLTHPSQCVVLPTPESANEEAEGFLEFADRNEESYVGVALLKDVAYSWTTLISSVGNASAPLATVRLSDITNRLNDITVRLNEIAVRLNDYTVRLSNIVVRLSDIANSRHVTHITTKEILPIFDFDTIIHWVARLLTYASTTAPLLSKWTVLLQFTFSWPVTIVPALEVGLLWLCKVCESSASIFLGLLHHSRDILIFMAYLPDHALITSGSLTSLRAPFALKCSPFFVAGIIFVIWMKVFIDDRIMEVSHNYLPFEFRQMLKYDEGRRSTYNK
ncbi:hypothetical protein LENED_012014 [Lentinula edodes]|uniref:Uncharacterized protein n=1 Tax=Lentinula edodes TaxID=5353 RepID=A0A1Q3ERI3_LENED|nr:hypothetical protein LENED_012014 [Lentinula edodes]